MIRLTRAALRRWLEALLHIHDTPQRTAAALAVGVLFGFSPFLGLHTVLGLTTAFVFNLNRVAVLVGVYANLPWFLAPYYAVTTMAAAWVLGMETPPDLRARLAALFESGVLSQGFWQQLWVMVSPLLWPFLLGSTFGAIILAGISYNLAGPAIAAGRRHLHLRHGNQGDAR